MTRNCTALTAAALAASCVPALAQAAAPKPMHALAKPGKMVSVYQADKCHMYFTAAQAKMFNYACPHSKGKMKMVKVSPAVAKMELAKTNKELTPMKMPM